jgi:hypothetical protein
MHVEPPCEQGVASTDRTWGVPLAGGTGASGSGIQFALTAAEYHRTIHRRDLRCSSRSQSSRAVSREPPASTTLNREKVAAVGRRAAGLDLDDCGRRLGLDEAPRASSPIAGVAVAPWLLALGRNCGPR